MSHGLLLAMVKIVTQTEVSVDSVAYKYKSR